MDATHLRLENGRLRGTLMLVLNGDWWVQPNAAAKTGAAARIELDATAAPESLTGTYQAEFGVRWKMSGHVSGTTEPLHPSP